MKISHPVDICCSDQQTFLERKLTHLPFPGCVGGCPFVSKWLPSCLCLFRPCSWAHVMNIPGLYLHVKPLVVIIIKWESPHMKCAFIYCLKKKKWNILPSDLNVRGSWCQVRHKHLCQGLALLWRARLLPLPFVKALSPALPSCSSCQETCSNKSDAHHVTPLPFSSCPGLSFSAFICLNSLLSFFGESISSPFEKEAGHRNNPFIQHR